MIEHELKNPNSEKPFLIFLRGLPGSGKSNLLNNLESESDFNSKILFLNPDKINENDPDFCSFSQELSSRDINNVYYKYRYLLKKAINGLSTNTNIVWDQPWTKIVGIDDTIYNIHHFLNKEGILKAFPHLGIVEIVIDPKLASERIEQRKALGGHGPTPNTFQTKFVIPYEDFRSDRYSTPILRLDGRMNIKTSREITLKFIEHIAKGKNGRKQR